MTMRERERERETNEEQQQWSVKVSRDQAIMGGAELFGHSAVRCVLRTYERSTHVLLT